MKPQELKPGDIIQCYDEADWHTTERLLKEAGYVVTMNCLISQKDGDKYWIEIADPEGLPFPDREERSDDLEHNNSML